MAVSSAAGDTTFDELWVEADRLASALVRAGVTEGATVALALRNSPDFVSTLLALCRLDTTVVLASPDHGRDELLALARTLPPACFVTDAGNVAKVAAALPIARSRTAGRLHVLSPMGEAASPVLPAAVVKLSSGSTAEPKGIAVTATSIVAEAGTVATTLGLGPGDRILAGVPLFHSYGFDLGVLQTLYAGTTLVLEDAFVPRRALHTLSGKAIDAFLGVPAQYRLFLATQLSTPPDLSSVRWLLSCTAPLSPDVIAAFADRFAAPICQHYGSSETGAVTTHLPTEVRRRPRSVGLPMAGVRVTIAGPDGRTLPAFTEGDVVVAGDALASGYVSGAPDGTSPFRDGSFWTGDVGFMDDDGFLTLLGRRDAMINVGGLKVSPSEVAATLERHPAVREAAVLGRADRMGEEHVYAVVAVATPVGEGELIAFCRDALADYKVPRSIEIRDELPRTPSGKVKVEAELER